MARKIWTCILFILFILSLYGCATGPELIKNNPYDYDISRIFDSDFETTWSAIIKALEAHPITTIEKASGILLTDWVSGNSPLYIRKVFIPLLQRKTKQAIGVYLAQLTPNVVYIAYVLEDGPAYAAGVSTGDIILNWNGETISKVSEFKSLTTKSQKVILRVLRYGTTEPLTFKILPKEITFAYNYIPITTRYKLNVRASITGDNKTEIKIINYEEGDFGHYTQFGWVPNYVIIGTSTLREKVLLDAIEAEIKKSKGVK